LERDSAGEWYYNTDYLFSADAGSGIPKDKLWLQNQAVALYQMQAMSPVQLWMILDNLGFPFASQIRQQIQEQMEQQQAMQQQQMMMQQQQQAQQAQMQQAQSQQQMAMQENARREDMQLKREQMNMKQQETQQNQMNGQVDSIIKNLSPEQQQAFMQLPEQEQVAVMKRMMNQ
jgi:hypothetical protein